MQKACNCKTVLMQQFEKYHSIVPLTCIIQSRITNPKGCIRIVSKDFRVLPLSHLKITIKLQPLYSFFRQNLGISSTHHHRHQSIYLKHILLYLRNLNLVKKLVYYFLILVSKTINPNTKKYGSYITLWQIDFSQTCSHTIFFQVLFPNFLVSDSF